MAKSRGLIERLKSVPEYTEADIYPYTIKEKKGLSKVFILVSVETRDKIIAALSKVN